jgi:putative ABC transport system permease protein
MLARLVFESFRRQKRRKLLAGLAVALGVMVATAMIAVATDVGDKINGELRRYQANLVIAPQEDTLDLEIGGANLRPPSDGAFLRESDLLNIKTIFWGHNILSFAPVLPAEVASSDGGDREQLSVLGTYFAKPVAVGAESWVTGVKTMHEGWRVRGEWPADDSSDVLVGERLAEKLGRQPGSRLDLAGSSHRISGILTTGDREDDLVLAPLGVVQDILHQRGAVRRVYVSALTKPEDAFARRDPRSMSPQLYDRWFCSPYAASIAYQLQAAIPHSQVEQIRQVEQTEGRLLARIAGMMLLVTLAALLASALGVSAAMATAIFERRQEVGLMKALGAGKAMVASVFFFEATILAWLGGSIGFVGGTIFAHQIGRSVFHSEIQVSPVLLPVLLGVAMVVAFAGSAAAIRRAVDFHPAYALRGDQ